MSMDEKEQIPVEKEGVARRRVLSAGSAAIAGLMALNRGRAQSMKEVSTAEKSVSGSDFGPENVPLRNLQANPFLPPDTDHGLTPSFWQSFSSAHRRVQEGGWSRQVNVEDFSISKEIAGVNMRLTAGGIRELHWHNAGEWAIMLNGKARITAIDAQGRSFVNDVGVNDLWFFPTGIPHSIQGLEPEGCEFLLVFDKGSFSEEDTTLLTDWLRHTPREVLAKNWQVPEAAITAVYQVPPSGYYIFQRPVPPPLAEDLSATSGGNGRSPESFSFSLNAMSPTHRSKGGEVKIVDSRNFKVSNTVAAAYIVVHPGGLRALHWHQNADEWQYYIQGKGRMTAFFNRSLANTFDFNAGDIGYVPRTFPHYIENTGNTDLIFLEMFKADQFQEVALNTWIRNIPPELAIDHLGISMQTLQQIPAVNVPVLPV